MPPVTETDPETAEIKAAGGVVWRVGGDGADGGVELAVVHRPRYDDWSFPKGKLDAGESWEEAALREVREEIGLSCTLGEELPAVFYTDHKGRAKAVRYWLMAPEAGDFEANEEVDEMRWLEPGQARQELTYPHDAELAARVQETLAR